MLLRSKSVRRVVLEGLEERRLMASTPIPFKVFPAIGQGTNFLQNITAGPDGRVYFSSGLANKLGSITTGGTVAVYDTTSVAPHGLSGITIGPDQNIWFTEHFSDAVGKLNLATKTVTKIAATFPSFSGPMQVTVGPDNNLWSEGFFSNILRITPGGTVTKFDYFGGGSGPLVNFNGRLYFVSGAEIRTITTSGTFGATVFKPSKSSSIDSITLGPDGKLWFTERSTDATNNYYGSLDKNGVIKEYPLAKTFGDINEITTGGDGNLYLRAGDYVIGFNTSGAMIRQQNLGGGSTGSGQELVAGPDGNLWFNRNLDNQIGVAYIAGGFNGKVANSINGVGLAGVRVYLDLNSNGTYDSTDKSVTTKADGSYLLNAAPGTYTVRFVTPSGYSAVAPVFKTSAVGAGNTVTTNFSITPIGTPLIGVKTTDSTAAQGVFGSPASTGLIQVLRESGSTSAVTIDLKLSGSGVLNTDFKLTVFGGSFTYTAATKILHLSLAAGAPGAAFVITPLTVAAGKTARTVTLTLVSASTYRTDAAKLFGTVTIAAT